ncbi:MAG: hypothetical protein HY816_16715 [Candidatus Wallbacteria bacterium]|nr:hypothetical protein [Candidatus Wallbacteria bacterium]
MDLDDPTGVALRAAEALGASGLRHALYGGLVLAAYGEARETRDADFCVQGVSARDAEAALRAAGFDLQVAFPELRLGGVVVSRLTLLPGGEDTGSSCVDLVSPVSGRFGAGVFERVLKGPVRGREISLVSPEDFILLKVLSTRDRDLSDAASVIRGLADRLDWDLLRSEVELLSAEVPAHDVTVRFARVEEMARLAMP